MKQKKSSYNYIPLSLIMKRLYCLLIMLCASGMVSFAQDYSYGANPKKIELSLGGQLFSGDGGLMDFYGMRMGVRFHPDWSVRVGYSMGVGDDWKTHRSDIADLGIAKIFRNEALKNFETHIAFGGGYLWDRYSDGVIGKALGMVDVEGRFYISPKGYLGATIKAYAGKDYAKTSFLGITWGVRF